MMRVAVDPAGSGGDRGFRSFSRGGRPWPLRIAAAAILLGCFREGAARGGDLAQPPSTSSRIFAERADTVDLLRAEQAFAAGDVVDGVTLLRRLLDRSRDSFVSVDGRVTGARLAAHELLRRQSRAAQEIFASAQAGSGAAIREAEEVGADLQLFGRGVAQNPGTEAEFRATDSLARVAFDRGEFEAAARLWEGLVASPGHAKRVTPAIVAKLCVALRHSGKDGRVSALAVRYAGLPLRLKGEPAKLTSVLHQRLSSTAIGPSVHEPGTVANGLTPPGFPPIWSLADGSEPAQELWAASRRSEARPLATPAGAVLTEDGTIVARRPAGLVALDAETGARRWELRLASGYAVSGEDGELRDLSRFEADYASGGVFGRLTADSERAYVVDPAAAPAAEEVRTASQLSTPIYSQPSEGDRTNRLLAVPLESEGSEPRPSWIAGGPQKGATVLADHYFFGPPCVTRDGLIALTEHRQCLNLVVLDAATGELLVEQPLGYVSRPVSIDPERGAAACPPAVSAGVAVCGTNAGFVVAFDYLVGRLLWAYEYASTEPEARTDGPTDRACYQGDAAFPCPAVIRQDRVVLMPHDSRLVHCIDLRTGAVLWTAPREDGLYVGCVTDTAALVVGRSQCRSLSLVSGSVLWSGRFGAPAGTGVATDRAYLLPLEEGRVVAVDLLRGKALGFDLPRRNADFGPVAQNSSAGFVGGRWIPGNLYSDGRTLIAVGPGGISRFRTAADLCRVADGTVRALELARLELAAGMTKEARVRLESLTGRNGVAEDLESARHLLRELHFLRLEEGTEDAVQESLAELDRLSVTAPERGRFLLHAAEYDLASANHPGLVGHAEELVALALQEPIPSPRDPTLLITPASWVPALVRRSADLPEPRSEDRPRLSEVSTPDLKRRLAFDPDSVRGTELKLELARRAADDGLIQRAELLRLQIRESEAAAAVAVPVARERRTPDQFDSAVPISEVSISGKLWAPADEGVRLAFGGMRRGFLTRGRDPFRVVDCGDSRQSRLAVIDLERGVRLGEVPIDARLRFPLLSRQPSEGHLVPVASVGKLHGLSLLESHRGEPVWTTDLPADGGLLPQVGPYGASFCTVQTRHELAVIDPTNGAVLWKRIDVPPENGLHGDQAAGLFGDGRALTMLDADGASYTIYRTKTGEEFGSGRLPIDRQRQRRAYGRKLFFIETGDARSTAQLWDPLRNACELEIDFEGRLLQTSTRDDELVLLFGDGRLLIFDTAAGATAVDVMLDPAEVAQAHTLWVFGDADRYYVSLYQADPRRFEEPKVTSPRRFEEPKVTSFIYDTPLSAAHVQGRLLAVDRANGKVLWSRSVDQRSIIDPFDHPTPFLVGVARMNDRRFGNRKTLLVEAIDKNTGATLGASDTLIADQPLQLRASNGQVELAGMNSTVELKFRELSGSGEVACGGR